MQIVLEILRRGLAGESGGDRLLIAILRGVTGGRPSIGGHIWYAVLLLSASSTRNLVDRLV